MTASALAGPTATGSAVSPLPSKDRSGLTSSALHLLDRITREGLGADVHYWVETATRSSSNEACSWCPEEVHASSVVAHSDVETAECCYYCVPAVLSHLADQGVHPETVTLDVALSPFTAYGWAGVTA